MSHASHKWVSLVHIKESPPCKYVNIKELSLDIWHVPGRVIWMSILGKANVLWCMSESYLVVVNELCLSWMRNAPATTRPGPLPRQIPGLSLSLSFNLKAFHVFLVFGGKQSSHLKESRSSHHQKKKNVPSPSFKFGELLVIFTKVQNCALACFLGLCHQ